MKLYIYSKFGVLEAKQMTLQDIENCSIPVEHASENISDELTVDAGPVDAVCCENTGNEIDFPGEQETQE